MNPDDLDKIVLAEKHVAPSPGFVHEVMLRVEAEALSSHRRPFPWIPFLASMLTLTVVSIRLFPADSVLRAMNSFSGFMADWIAAPNSVPAIHNVLMPVSASILGSLLLIWLSLRIAGAGD